MVGPGLTRNVLFCWNIMTSKNNSKPVLIFWSQYTKCIRFVYYRPTVLKVVSCYDLSVMFMSVMGFQKIGFSLSLQSPLCIREKRDFISLSRSVMNEIVNILWKYCCGVAAGVFARFSCRHSWNLWLRLT